MKKKKSFFFMTSKKPPNILSSNIKDLLSRISSALVVRVYEPDNILLGKIIKKYLEERAIEWRGLINLQSRLLKKSMINHLRHTHK